MAAVTLPTIESERLKRTRDGLIWRTVARAVRTDVVEQERAEAFLDELAGKANE